ncbi:hypothetical protein GM921_17075 [Pedobacter sp. LMG 31464]|uniref:Uncharacterized protein n=1 Tax=Pedobacter planticolens TaxID=2679964 RepID=A0A923DZY1_9SPHI|nr:hypothetical protein [Pedobacter planticolens]MBB2147216.1 hypothetical protein [Pedobacter planticolens]
MKRIVICILVLLNFSCSDSSQKKVDDAISKTSDSLVAKLDKVNDSLKGVKENIEKNIPKVKIEKYQEIPISLQWISFDKTGSAKLVKTENNWYTFKGEQTNDSNEYLKIDGKISRVDKNHIKFIGTIITYIKHNNGGKPCEKTGEQIFLKKDGRTYYRLQNMENCGGGRVVDYIDLYTVDTYL